MSHFGKLIEYVKNYRTGGIEPVIDKDRGAFPFGSNSGQIHVGSDGLFTSALLNPSGRNFVMEGFHAVASQTTGFAMIYDGVSDSAGLVTIAPFYTTLSVGIRVDNLRWVFESGVFLSTGAASLSFKVWGYLVNSVL